MYGAMMAIFFILVYCRVQRYCNETVTFGSVTIPKGSDVVIPLQLIHRLPQYWPDPDKFDPER